MGFRFRRSLKIAPGIRLNFSKSGVSTTVGGRGASVNIGKRGMYANAGLPGTGISYREKIGGSGAATPGDASTAKGTGNGCAGCGCLSFLGLAVLVAMCSGPSTSPSPSASSPSMESLTSAAPSTETFYLHGAMRVRGGPGTGYPIQRTLPRGSAVELGPKDANGWAQVFMAGAAAGYLYRASDLVRSSPPPVQSETPAYRAPSSGYYTGPRGGCYTYSASGRKRYVDHSFCR